MVSPPNHFILDEIFEKYGHTVVWLPLHHPELNPIELVWKYIKGRVRRKCLANNLEDKIMYGEKCFPNILRRYHRSAAVM